MSCKSALNSSLEVALQYKAMQMKIFEFKALLRHHPIDLATKLRVQGLHISVFIRFIESV